MTSVRSFCSSPSRLALALLTFACGAASAATSSDSSKPIEPILRVQIFLDRQLFGPGKVDGRPGEFTLKALHRYQRLQGLPETDLEPNNLDLSSVQELYTNYTIREEDLKFIGEVPKQPSEQCKKKYLPYETLEEFLTERFHCSETILEAVNGVKKMTNLKPGDVVSVPNVEPFRLEDLNPIAGLPDVPEFHTRIIHIDTKEKMLDLYDEDRLLASFPITPGSGHLATPPGKWRILGIAQMPTFRWDASVLEYGIRSDHFYELPFGPNNPVGVMWIGLNRPGIGVHGTNNPQTIGRSASHGCMRTANWDVARLSKMITKEMTVIIEGPPAEPRPVLAKNESRSSAQAASSIASPPPAPPAAQQGERRFKWFWQH